MADEPRRSGRATKGQNKALDEPAETAKPKKGAAKAKPTKKAAAVEEAADEDEDGGDEVIRCVCGHNKDDKDGMAFICCDACENWQHNVCMGIPLNEDEQPEHYFCEKCRPEEHEELLEAMSKGIKIWEERQKDAKSKKKNPKKNRKPARSSRTSEVKPESDAADEEEQPVEEAPAQSGAMKRKFEDDSHVEGGEDGNDDVRVPGRSAGRGDKRRKSGAREAAAADPETALVDMAQLPEERQRVAKAIAGNLKPGIDAKVKAGIIKDDAEALSRQLASLIEYELYQTHSPKSGKFLTEPYRNQFRSILANVKKNSALRDRIINKTLSAAELAVMATQDMASEELQRERIKMKEEADKQAVMVQEDDKPRVRRTHKGDEYVDDAGSGNQESVFTSKPVRRRESEMDADGPMSPTLPQAPVSPTAASRPGNDERRRSSANFDIANVWAKAAASPDADVGGREFSPSNGTHTIPHRPSQNAADDADIDRLLADDDDNYSPAESETIWRGPLAQDEVASLVVSARFVAGNDFSRYMPWSSFLPSRFQIEGRLDRAKADDYLCGLQWSKRSDVTVLALSAYDNRAAFDQIFEYFHSRSKYAVGSKRHGCSDLVKDLYITPVDAGGPAPPHIDLLDYCALPFPARERLLLATFVVNKPAAWDASGGDGATQTPTPTGGRPSLGGGPAMSPVGAQAPYALPPAPTPPAVPQLQFAPEAAAVLGEFANCAVARDILAATRGNVSTHEAENMVAVFRRNAEARESMEAFGRMLSVD